MICPFISVRGGQTAKQMKRTLLIGLSILVVLLGLPPVEHGKAAAQRAVITPENGAHVGEIMELGRGTPQSLTWSPDGKWLAVGTTTAVWLYDSANLNAVPTRTGDTATTVFVSTDSRYLVMTDRTLTEIIDVAQAKTLTTIQDPANPITVTLNGQWYDLSLGYTYLRPGSAAPFQAFLGLKGFDGTDINTLISISPNERHLLITDRKAKTTQLWNMATGQKVVGLDPNTIWYAWSPDSRYLYTSAEVDSLTHTYIQFFSVADGSPIYTLDNSGSCSIAGWSPDETKFVLSCLTDDFGNSVSVVEAGSGSVLGAYTGLSKTGYNDPFLEFSSDGRSIFFYNTSTSTIDLLRWDFNSGKTDTIASLDNPRTTQIAAMAVRPGDQDLIVQCADNVLRVYDTATGKLTASLRFTTRQNDVIFAPDSQRLYSGSSLSGNEAGKDLAIFAWDLNTGQLTAEMNGNQPYVTLDVSGNGKYLLSTGSDPGQPTAILWDLNTFKAIEVLPDIFTQLLFAGHDYAAMSPLVPGDVEPFILRSFSTVSDATVMYPTGLISRNTANSNNGKLTFIGDRFYKSGQLVARLGEADMAPYFKVAFSPDDSHFATAAGYSREVLLWNSQTLSVQARWTIHHDRTRDGEGELANPIVVAFSPDGHVLAASGSTSLVLIDVVQRSVLENLTTRSIVTSMAFSADGTMIATGNDQGNIQIWGVKRSQ